MARNKKVEAELARERRENAIRFWKSKQPCRSATNIVAADGSCLRCGADQGVACRDPLPKGYGVATPDIRAAENEERG